MEALALSGLWKALFAIAILGLLAVHGIVMYHRIRLMMVGPKENRFDRIKDRIGRLLHYGLGQGRMPDELVPGLLHIFIFGGFMILSIRTLELFVMGFGGYEYTLHHIPAVGGVIGPVYSFIKDILVILVITGCVGFMWRRLVSQPKRMQGLHHWEPVAILFWICGLMVFDMLHEGGYNAVAVANGVAAAAALIG